MNLPTKLRMMAKGCACNGDVVRADALARAAIDAYRLTEENAKLREFLELVAAGDSAGDEAKSIMVHTYIYNAKQLLNQPKDQNNDK